MTEHTLPLNALQPSPLDAIFEMRRRMVLSGAKSPFLLHAGKEAFRMLCADPEFAKYATLTTRPGVVQIDDITIEVDP